MKPDIVFFGESLPNEFHRQMEIDKDICDLLIVIGSTLKVRPVALIPSKYLYIERFLRLDVIPHLRAFQLKCLGDGR